MFRQRLYTIVQRSKRGDKISHFYDWLIMGMALISVTPMMFRVDPPWLSTLETITVYFLFLDYILRWITHDYFVKKHSPWAFIIYPLTPFAILDILSILPSLGLLPPTFMILRLFRLTKIFHYSRSFQHIVNVFHKQRRTLLSVLLIALFYIFISALIMFVHEPADTFPSFFDALYWATTALTTVGYGDIYPTSQLGKLISMISSLFGVAIIAMPAGIVTGGFLEEIQRDNGEYDGGEDDE